MADQVGGLLISFETFAQSCKIGKRQRKKFFARFNRWHQDNFKSSLSPIKKSKTYEEWWDLYRKFCIKHAPCITAL